MGSSSGGPLRSASHRSKRDHPSPPPPTQPPNPRPSPNPNPNLDASMSEGTVAGEEAALRGAPTLSREEVLRRRSRRVKQLLGIYEGHYWALAEEVRVKHRQYYWEFGKSPERSGGDAEAPEGEGRVKSRQEQGEVEDGKRKRCNLAGCKSYAMPLTKFCHSHILMDEKQTLYKPCGYVVKSVRSAQVVCGKPVLRAAVPLLCSGHFKKAQKHASNALKEAGLSVSSSSRPAPKFHVIIAEYVRQIQSRRREMLIHSGP